MNILVTGGAGFIGSAVIRKLLKTTNDKIINVDKLTYAGNLSTLDEILENPEYRKRYSFEKVDICDETNLSQVFTRHNPDLIMHLAAESHVDRSIDGPKEFIETNIIGTFNLLQISRKYYLSLPDNKKKTFRFHHISTDEVYGSLNMDDKAFTEKTAYSPNSPYSASKASSDHLVRAWFETFGLPTLITNCSNNYGPYQFPEKLIPLMILNATQWKPLPVYGDGKNIRDWLYVDDHAEALITVLKHGKPGETYNIGGNCEKANIDVVNTICDILDEIKPEPQKGSRRQIITFVKDRLGHDRRYAIDASKIKQELKFSPKETFETGLRKTITWYLHHDNWIKNVLNNKA